MRLFQRYRQGYAKIPPSASGRTRHDPTLSLANAAISGMLAASAAARRIPAPTGGDSTIALTVERRRVVARDQDVIELTLAPAGGDALPRWYPGAHLDLHLPSGLVRQYSLCGPAGSAQRYRIAVRRIPEGGGGSIEIHDGLAEGATVYTHGPRNAFPLTVPGYGSPTRRLRFIAGGIGITPILPMLDLARRLRVDWSMVYTGRTPDSLPFIDEVAAFGANVEIRTDDTCGLPTATELLGQCSEGTAVYACGPAPMLTAIRAALVGRDDVELHFERFAAAPVVDGRPFQATATSSGEPIDVGAEETLLAALRRAGVNAPYSCQQGFCGTCRTRVLAGEVDHRDTLLTEPERAAGMMLTCVSRAARESSLTLDL
ncbi:ferredoxin [Mycolicibacterium cyprinidarum]|uniref:Ferredoxin n=1 Tax=Mycolicibacterium cyprinidarum TaxID=2860311 RepID=A0ABQ4V597_9MYCO|nr:ferredoxin [Mycolicibacterium sp. NGTWSNA01]